MLLHYKKHCGDVLPVTTLVPCLVPGFAFVFLPQAFDGTACLQLVRWSWFSSSLSVWRRRQNPWHMQHKPLGCTPFLACVSGRACFDLIGAAMATSLTGKARRNGWFELFISRAFQPPFFTPTCVFTRVIATSTLATIRACAGKVHRCQSSHKAPTIFSKLFDFL